MPWLLERARRAWRSTTASPRASRKDRLALQFPAESVGAARYARAPRDCWKYMGPFAGYVRSMLDAGKPVIARLDGMAVGGGNESHPACELSIIAEHALVGQVGAGVGSVAAGRERRFLAAGGRVEEFVELYRSMGFEARAEAVSQAELDPECEACRVVICREFVTLYTHRLPGTVRSGGEEERLGETAWNPPVGTHPPQEKTL